MTAYMGAQTLIKTILAGVDGLSVSNVTEGDLRVLDAGNTYAAVLFPGSIPGVTLSSMDRVQEYECILDLFIRFDDDTTYTDFGTFRDLVIDALYDDPAPSSTYFLTNLRSDGDPAEVYDKMGAGPFFITQRLVITVQEQV